MSEQHYSAFNKWRASGGSLSMLPNKRRQAKSLFPYMLPPDVRRRKFSPMLLAYLAFVIGGIYMAIQVISGFGRPARVSEPEPNSLTPTASMFEVASAPVSLLGFVSTPEKYSISFSSQSEPEILHPTRVPVSAAFVQPINLPISDDLAVSVTPEPTPSLYSLRVLVGWYWPDLSPDYCWQWSGGGCQSMMASGADWRFFADSQAAACPVEFPLYSYLEIETIGRVRCLDRGQWSQCLDGVCRVALLSRVEIEVRELGANLLSE